jgi:hypothetical protein
MMEAVRTSETSVNNYFTRQYNPEDSSEHHTRRRENLKSHKEMHSFYTSPDINRIVISKRMRQMGNAAGMGATRNI